MKNEKMQKTQHNKISRNQATSIWKDKKGVIPTTDIFGAIQRFFSNFLTTAPKPLLYLIFLLFLVGIASLFGFFINITGNFCDTAGNEYRTGTFSLITNFELIQNMPDNDQLGQQEIIADERLLGILPQCTNFFNEPYTYTGGFFSTNKTYIVDGSGYYYDGSYCTDCESDKIFDNITGDNGRYCLGDVYAITYDEKGALQKSLCGTKFGGCEPPTGYFYDQSRNSYVCINDDCEGKTIGTIWNEQLLKTGALIVQEEDISRQDYRKVVSLDCEAGDVNPKFQFFGIEILDFRLWIALLLLAAIIWGVYKIKHP